MKLENTSSFLSMVFAGLIGGVVSAAMVVGLFALLRPAPSTNTGFVQLSQTPTIDKLDGLTCPRGLTLVTQVRGQEDGFARTAPETAAIDPALRRYGSFDDLYKRLPRTYGLRNFDDIGADKVLIQNFDMPKNSVSGTLLLRIKGAAKGAGNDYVRLISSVPYINDNGAAQLVGFSISLQDPLIETIVLGQLKPTTNEKLDPKREIERIIAIPLDAFKAGPNDTFGDIISYFNQIELSGSSPTNLLTLGVYDDTAVDVAGLALCVEPDQVRGVTFVEHTAPNLGPDLSLLSCAIDDTQSTCGPYSGDTLCTKALPLACYKEGVSTKPDSLAKVGANDANFVGGEVRATQPIAGSTFATIEQADNHCVSQFGAGWRVLTYQEGGGGVVISRSQLKPKTRLWIDIRDQPRARCWDRP